MIISGMNMIGQFCIYSFFFYVLFLVVFVILVVFRMYSYSSMFVGWVFGDMNYSNVDVFSLLVKGKEVDRSILVLFYLS